MHDSITEMHADRMTADDMSHAVAAGLRSAISDPAFWDAAVYAMQARAKTEAGGWLLGGLKAFASKVAWVALIAGAIYLVGGWTAVIAAWKASHQ